MSAVMKVAKNDLSLMELMGNAYEQIDQYRWLLGQARQSRQDATLAIFRAGEWLSLARKKFRAEGRGKWTAFLKEYGIPRTTGWEAETLFKRAKTEAAVSKMTPTEAKRTFQVVKPKKTTPTEPTVPSVNAGRVTAGSGNGSGVTAPMTPRRFGEPPPDPDRDRRQADVAPPRPKPSQERRPTTADEESDVVGRVVSAPSGAAKQDVEPGPKVADTQSSPGEKHSVLTTIVQTVRRLEVLLEDIAKLDLAEEPKDNISREIDHGIAVFTKLKGELAR